MPNSTAERCPACGRRPGWTKDGDYRRHRIDADNPVSRYCGLSPAKDKDAR